MKIDDLRTYVNTQYQYITLAADIYIYIKNSGFRLQFMDWWQVPGSPSKYEEQDRYS